ncbi:MAG: hypothetical protein KC619_31720 [Myxococcales bacterium]|nr:hypothetical protein [Myxococcales bacterium]
MLHAGMGAGVARGRLFVAAAWVLVGCGGSSVPSTARPSAPGGPTEAASPVVRVLLTGGVRVMGGQPVAEHHGDGFYTIGPHRVRSDEAGAEVALARFTTPIRQAVRCGAGWIFLTEDRVLFHASAFLGPPRRLADLPRAEWEALHVSPDGHYVARARRGPALSGRCGEAPTPFRPGGQDTLRALSIGQAVWLAQISDAVILASDDAGATWRAVELPEAWDRAGIVGAFVSWDDFRRPVRDGDHFRLVPLADGEPPPREPAREDLSSAPHDARLRAALEALVAASPSVRRGLSFPGDRTARIAPGLSYFRERYGEGLLAIRDRALERVELPGDGQCGDSLQGVEGLAVGRCAEGLMISTGGPWRRLAFDARRGVVVPLDAGRIVDLFGGCGEGGASPAMCLVDVETAAERTVACPGRPLGAARQGLALLVPDDQPEVSRVFELDTGEHHDIPLPPREAREELPRPATNVVTLVGDGRVLVQQDLWIPPYDHEIVGRWLARPPDYALVPLEAPEGAVHVGFASDLAIAIGRRAADVWVSEDEGATWRRVALEVEDGSRWYVYLDAWSPRPRPFACDDWGCGIEGVVWVERTDEPELSLIGRASAY